MSVGECMNSSPTHSERALCRQCAHHDKLGFDFTMAFQPIIDCRSKTVFGYEALVRGLENQSAYSIISRVTDDNRYLFDQMCRVKAIALAAKLKMNCMLSINFLPNAIYNPQRCIRTTLDAASTYQFPTENILFEFTESEKVEDSQHIRDIVEYYQALGFKTAIDDFGAGYSGLSLLADFQTDIVKLDMELIRNIESDAARQTIIGHCLAMFRDLGVRALAEGIESEGEYLWLKQQGVELMQGYYFARPGFESLPEVDFSRL